MSIEDLGEGSIVKTIGNLYKKRSDGWVLLEESIAVYMGGVREFEVIHEVKKGPLDDFVVGDIISFMSNYGPRIALKHRDDFWEIIGMVGEKTSRELEMDFYPTSVRKVGSICGEG